MVAQVIKVVDQVLAESEFLQLGGPLELIHLHLREGVVVIGQVELVGLLPPPDGGWVIEIASDFPGLLLLLPLPDDLLGNKFVVLIATVVVLDLVPARDDVVFAILQHEFKLLAHLD